MERWILILGAIAPCLALLAVCMFLLRRCQPSVAYAQVVWAFLLGILSILIAGAMIWLFNQWTWRLANNRIAYALYDAFLLAAIPEELSRFVILRWRLARLPPPLTAARCLLLGAVVGLGFAAFENVGYCREGWGTVLERSITATPFHTLAGAILGYFTGLSIQTRQLRWAALGVLITSCLHGINNFNWKLYYAADEVPGEVLELPTEGLADLLISGWPSNIAVLLAAIAIVFVLARRPLGEPAVVSLQNDVSRA